jgi:signal transduction histidine kinase
LTQMVEFKVKDSGIGISPDDLPRVFDRFFRVDRTRSRRDAPDGTGLGLSICKAVVEAYGGTVRCDSVRAQGTEFRVELPLAPVQELDSSHREISASL